MNGNVTHALGLHMHQPPGNLRLLIETNEWEAQQIIRCYERAARYAHQLKDVAFYHVGFSGVLLEQFLDPRMVDLYRRFVDIPAMLESYRTAQNIELIGMGYYHPIFPLIPQEDWDEQLASGRQLLKEVFCRAPRGFWPPEMAFCMEMIPALVRAGYEYVVVDGVHVRAKGGGKTDIYQPYCATYGGKSITVIPRDRDISNAQESGLDPSWFANEIRHKVANSPHPQAPRLITTWSDGENGGWFRQMAEEAGFFGHFFTPYMNQVRSGQSATRTVLLSDYLQSHSATEEASVQTGAWNIGSACGVDFRQWAGSESQRQALKKIVEVSSRYWKVKHSENRLPSEAENALKQARHWILEGETSCFLFWGDAWVPKLYERTREAEKLLALVENHIAGVRS
ncbi:MAG TPA: glycoside hydrolase family 57 [Acidobacteriota bacterium]|nr:glycoside hydrolase family 57 [Acidobacteriota bacterium]